MIHDSAPAGNDPIARILSRPLVVALSLLALAFLAYFPALKNEFYNDDAIFLNHARNVLGHPLALFTERPLNYFRPVYAAFVTLIYAVSGSNPVGYFIAAILLHAATAYLVWRLALRLVAQPIAAFLGAAFFCVCFAHSEATVWIAAHNSTLVCFFALLATLSHVRACETERVAPAALTALLVAATLLTKEPGIVVLAWLPLVEWRLFGFKHCFSKGSLARYGAIVLAAAVYLIANPRLLGDALAGDAGGGPPKELRSTFGFVTPDRVLGAAFWMFSPLRSTHQELSPWLGGSVLLVVLLVAFIASKRRGYDLAFAIAFMVVAIVPACSTRLQQMNGSRLYYFSTAGSALMIAGMIALLEERGGLRSRIAAGALAAGFAIFASVHIRNIHAVNDADYLPISRLQTKLAHELATAAPTANGKLIYVLEPWLDNIMHAQQFLEFFAGIDSKRVRRSSFKREEKYWIRKQRDALGNLVYDTDANGALILANSLPSTRNSAQNLSRAVDTGVYFDEVRVLVISP